MKSISTKVINPQPIKRQKFYIVSVIELEGENYYGVQQVPEDTNIVTWLCVLKRQSVNYVSMHRTKEEAFAKFNELTDNGTHNC